MTFVWAKNGKGVKRRFTQIAWDLLGKNKEGWTDISGQEIQDKKPVTDKVEKPNTGGQKRSAPVIEQKIGNVLSKERYSKIDEKELDKPLVTPKEDKTEENSKETFLKAAEGINPGAIKDYFDDQNPKIKYNKKDDALTLATKLGEHLNFSIVELQKIF